MALNLNKSVSEELSVCGKLSQKTYATERGQFMKRHAKNIQRKGHLWKDFVYWTLNQTFLELD